jgi:hypothetical protein
VDFVTKEDVVLALSSPLGIMVGIITMAMALPLTGAGLLAKLTYVCLEMGRIYGCITADDYLQGNSLGNQSMENIIENVVP